MRIRLRVMYVMRLAQPKRPGLYHIGLRHQLTCNTTSGLSQRYVYVTVSCLHVLSFSNNSQSKEQCCVDSNDALCLPTRRPRTVAEKKKWDGVSLYVISITIVI